MNGNLITIKGKVQHFILSLSVFIYMIFADSAFLLAAPASGGLGDMGKRLGENIEAGSGFVKYGAFFFGLCVTVAGILEFKGVGQKPDCTVKGGAIKVIVGVMLLSLGAFLQTMSSTLFGTGDSHSEGYSQF